MPDVTYYESSLSGGQIERVLKYAVLSSTQSLNDTAKEIARNNISALEKKANGLSASDMNLSVQSSLSRADSAVQPGSLSLLPSGGSSGQVLKKLSSDNYDVAWADESGGGGGGAVTSVDGKTGAVTILPTGGTPGQVLTKATNADYSVAWADSSGGGSSTGGIFFGECSTAASTTAKEVSISGITAYLNGLSVRIRFANASGSGNSSLNVNSLGAKTISGGGNLWASGDIIDFVYRDNYWYVVNDVKANYDRYGKVKLASGSMDSDGYTAVSSNALRSFDTGVVTGLQEYNPNETHDVGEHVRYNNNIYECNTAITTPEAWNSSHWTLLKPMLKLLSVFRQTITLSTTWSGSDPYTQTVTLPGINRITANTKFDIQPDATVIAQMIDDGVKALYIANDNGTLTAYAVGAAPTASLTVQVTYYETAQGGLLWSY